MGTKQKGLARGFVGWLLLVLLVLREDEQREKSVSHHTVQQLIVEKEQALADLNSVEKSLADLFRRYEKVKEVLEGFRKNEEVLKKCAQEYLSRVKKEEQRYQALKIHAEEKLDRANAEIAQVRGKAQQEQAAYQASLRKEQLKVDALERTLEQKVLAMKTATDKERSNVRGTQMRARSLEDKQLMWERLVCYHGTHLLVKNGETGVVPHYGMARSMLGRCRRGRCRRRYEVLLLQLLLRAGKEGRIQSTRSERPVLLLQQLQRKKPGLQSQHLLELLLSPPPVLVLAPLAEADMRGKNKSYRVNDPEWATSQHITGSETDAFLGQNCSGGVRMGGGAEHGVANQPSHRLHFMVRELLTPLTPSCNQVSPHSAQQAILQLRIYSFSCWLKRLVSTSLLTTPSAAFGGLSADEKKISKVSSDKCRVNLMSSSHRKAKVPRSWLGESPQGAAQGTSVPAPTDQSQRRGWRCSPFIHHSASMKRALLELSPAIAPVLPPSCPPKKIKRNPRALTIKQLICQTRPGKLPRGLVHFVLPVLLPPCAAGVTESSPVPEGHGHVPAGTTTKKGRGRPYKHDPEQGGGCWERARHRTPRSPLGPDTSNIAHTAVAFPTGKSELSPPANPAATVKQPRSPGSSAHALTFGTVSSALSMKYLAAYRFTLLNKSARGGDAFKKGRAIFITSAGPSRRESSKQRVEEAKLLLSAFVNKERPGSKYHTCTYGAVLRTEAHLSTEMQIWNKVEFQRIKEQIGAKPSNPNLMQQSAAEPQK
ncbi:Transforming acidic coiled-coil-containing protein 2 [Anas platyrhynchos]|uniref:Transforming acidic coiled-coil-containing protein 2 n=1 Tax=Anas platyrhynchos TaxID=8839 RepID=R0LF23_ANAPL|nr:Transforming acidic coiled-coil-containing protein 2 [Anas platyrhynchos]